MSDDNDKKQITIDPTMFEFSSSKTRKQKVQREKIPKLKLRPPSTPNRIDHTIKSHALKFLRNKQLKIHQARLNGPDETAGGPKPVDDTFVNDFDSSLEYLSSIQQKPAELPRPFQAYHTLRSPIKIEPPIESLFDSAKPAFTDETNIQIEEADVFSAAKPFEYENPKDQPLYGCLKNGNLPTYRNYHRTLRSKTHDIVSIDDRPSYKEWLQKNTEMRKVNERREKMEMNKMEEKKRTPKYVKRKKTVRRTYHIGRSLNKNKVGVLVSNRTIRRDIDKKCNELKQTPIEDVRKALVKKGMIKVGTIAPNDVLRTMYESLGTICGEVKNHNSDNLIYNYFNDTENNA